MFPNSILDAIEDLENVNTSDTSLDLSRHKQYISSFFSTEEVFSAFYNKYYGPLIKDTNIASFVSLGNPNEKLERLIAKIEEGNTYPKVLSLVDNIRGKLEEKSFANDECKNDVDLEYIDRLLKLTADKKSDYVMIILINTLIKSKIQSLNSGDFSMLNIYQGESSLDLVLSYINKIPEYGKLIEFKASLVKYYEKYDWRTEQNNSPAEANHLGSLNKRINKIKKEDSKRKDLLGLYQKLDLIVNNKNTRSILRDYK